MSKSRGWDSCQNSVSTSMGKVSARSGFTAGPASDDAELSPQKKHKGRSPGVWVKWSTKHRIKINETNCIAKTKTSNKYAADVNSGEMYSYI